MRNLARVVSAVILASSLIACSDDDEVMVPNPLPVVEAPTVNYEVVWTKKITNGVGEQFIDLKPAVGYGKMYLADATGKLVAIDPTSGEQIWQAQAPSNISAGVAVGSSRVVVGTREGEVVTFSAETGDVEWTAQLSSEIISSPAIDEGYVVVNTVDGNVVALDAASGEQRWFYDRNLPPLTLRGTSSPIITRGAAIAGFANGKLGVFILQNGQIAWEKQITAPSGRSDLERLVDVDAQPVIIGESVYAASYNGNLASLDTRTGESRWSRELSTFSDMAIDRQLILVTHDNGHVSALNRNNGVLLWTQKALFLRQVTSSTAYEGSIVTGDYAGYLHVLDRADGSLIGQMNLNSLVDPGRCYDPQNACKFFNFKRVGIATAPFVTGKLLYVYLRNGQLVALQPATPEEAS